MDESAINRLIDEAERVLGGKYTQIVTWLKDRRTVEAIARLIAERRWTEILPVADLRRAGTALASAANAQHIKAAEQVSNALADLTDNLIRYDVGNPRAVSAMQETGARLVREVSVEQQQVLANVLQDGLSRGENPLTTARTVRESIGLTATQEQHVRNYRRQLEQGSQAALDRQLRDRRYDRMVERAAETPLTPAQIDRMVDRYRQRYVKYRSEVIARTEGLRAVNSGQHAAFQQAVDTGELRRDTLESVWHPGPAVGDYRPEHRGIAPVPFGQPFVTGDGILMRYPHDPLAPISAVAGCRCTYTTRIVAVGARRAA